MIRAGTSFEMRDDSDLESAEVFLNYVNHADFSTVAVTARIAGRLVIDPGFDMKMNNARIETERGSSSLIAEGTPDRPIVFNSLRDDR